MLICVGETYTTGAAMPLTAAVTPSSEYCSGLAVALSVVFARFAPYTATTIPGLTEAEYAAGFAMPAMPAPELSSPSTNIIGMLTDCGTALADCIARVAR